MMIEWRVRYEVLGDHVHCRLFCAPLADRTFAFCGKFVVGTNEFEDLQCAFPGAEFIEDKTGGVHETGDQHRASAGT